MSVRDRTTPLERPSGADPSRRISRIAGLLYLLTFVSIPTLLLYKPVNDHTDFILGTGSTTGVVWGTLSEIVVALAGVGTALVLYPVTRRYSRTAALGFVAARVVESCLILVGVICLLTILALRQDVAGTAGGDATSLVTVGQALTAGYGRTFLLSQSLMPVACDLFLGGVLYRSGLVPRVLPMIAFVGAPLLLASDIAVFFGAFDRISAVPALAAIPVAVFEFSLGVYLLVHGFRPAAVARLGGPEPRLGLPDVTPVVPVPLVVL